MEWIFVSWILNEINFKFWILDEINEMNFAFGFCKHRLSLHCLVHHYYHNIHSESYNSLIKIYCSYSLCSKIVQEMFSFLSRTHFLTSFLSRENLLLMRGHFAENYSDSPQTIWFNEIAVWKKRYKWLRNLKKEEKYDTFFSVSN